MFGSLSYGTSRHPCSRSSEQDLLLGGPWEKLTRACFINEDDGDYLCQIKSPDGRRIVQFVAAKANPQNRFFARETDGSFHWTFKSLEDPSVGVEVIPHDRPPDIDGTIKAPLRSITIDVRDVMTDWEQLNEVLTASQLIKEVAAVRTIYKRKDRKVLTIIGRNQSRGWRQY